MQVLFFSLGVPLMFKLEVRHLFSREKNHNAEDGKERLKGGVMREKKAENPYSVESGKLLSEIHFNGLVLR